MRRFGSASIIAATSVLLLEAALRIWNPLPSRVRGDRLGLPPNARYTIHNPDDPKLDRVFTTTRNQLGFRGPDVPTDFARRLSIVAVGGSTTECILLADDKTWPAVMAAELAKTRPDVWVNNAGVDGSSTIAHLTMLESRVIPLHPKIVLFLTGVNDVDLYPGWMSRLDTVWSRVARYSEAASVSLNVVRAFRAWPVRYKIDEGTIDVRGLPRKSSSESEIQSLIARHAASIAAYHDRLAALVDRSRAAGIQPVLITQPMLAGEIIDPATGVDLSTVYELDGTGRNGAESWRLMERYNDQARALAAAGGVTLIDLARLLPKDSRLFIDFVHYGNAGAAEVGRIIARELASRLGGGDGV